MRIYVSGPMTGLPDLNFPAFNAAAAKLRALGHEVVNPAEIDQGESPTWQSCMRKDLAALVTCDAVATLSGWLASRGARLEVGTARELGMVVLPLWAIKATLGRAVAAAARDVAA